MDIQRLDPANDPVTYVRVAITHGIAYFTDHIARPQYKTVREQTEGILLRYEELFEQFNLKKENIVFAVNYLDKRYEVSECEDIWQEWMGDIKAETMWIPSSFCMDRQVALTLFVATDEEHAKKARADKGWKDTMEDMHRFNGAPVRIAKHNGVCYLVGGACMDKCSEVEQTKALLKNMESLFEVHGLKKENMIFQFSYVSDRPEVDLDAYEEVWQNWVGKGTAYPPSGIRAQVEIPKGHDVEISILVAMEEEE